MTAVLVVVKDGRAWVGADSRVTNSGTYRDDAAKVVERHGWVWAIAGAGTLAGWLRTHLHPQRPGEDDESYLLDVTSTAQGWLRTRDELCGQTDDKACAHLVAARGGRAWVASGYGVETIGELYAMGDPTAPAAAFLCTDGGLPVPDRIRLAIEAVARISAYVGGPVNVVEAV